MLLLCSNGLSSKNLISKVNSFSYLNNKAVLVVTADNVYKANNKHVSRVKYELESLGFIVDIIDIDYHSIKDLNNYSIVEFIGGNPFYLLHSLRKSNAKPVIYDISKSSNKLLVGWSAGAFVMQNSLDLVNIFSPELNFLNIKDLTAMSITDTEILPHYNRFKSKFVRFEARCLEYEKENNHKVIRLNDGDGVLISQDEIEIIRSV